MEARMSNDFRHRHRRSESDLRSFWFAPQVLPALQVAEWLTDRFGGKRHRIDPVEDVARTGRRRR
jgi:hypothetical protein